MSEDLNSLGWDLLAKEKNQQNATPASRLLDIVWTSSRWLNLVPLFQAALDKAINTENSSDWKPVVRVAKRRTDGSLDLKSLHGAHVLIPPAGETIGFAELNACKDTLRLVSIPATGTDGVDIQVCRQIGIFVTCAAGLNAWGTAEGTFLLLLAIARKFTECQSRLKNSLLGAPQGCKELPGLKVGIIGNGSIGKHFANMCAAFRMEVCGRIDSKSSRLELEGLLRNADIISLHVSLNKFTYNLLSTEEFKLCKDGVWILNTARGDVIDRDALQHALASGKVGRFATDVWWAPEPADPLDPLLSHPNVVVTPHSASGTDNFYNGIASLAASNIRKVFVDESDERDLLNPVINTSNPLD